MLENGIMQTCAGRKSYVNILLGRGGAKWKIITFSNAREQGCSLSWSLVRGNISSKRDLMSFALEKTSRISLSCKLVSVQYQEYEHG